MSAAPGPSASSVALSRPGPFPNWMMLERFVFRRDDEESFPDDRKAYLSVSGTTSWNAPFRIAFCLHKPPLPSRLYAHLPSFPDPRRHIPLAILATHRHLILLRIATDAPGRGLLQDFLIYSAYYSSSFKSLPPCTQPYTDYTKTETGDSLPRGHPLPKDKQRLLMVESMGLLCAGSHEFAVVELRVFTSESSKVYADLCFIRSSTSAAPVVAGRWESVRVPILDSSKDPWNLCCWQTDTIVPFDSFLCWVDYHRGIIICDPFGDPIPTVSFLPLPIDKPTCAHTHYQVKPSSWLYRGVSSIYGDRALNFINVIRHDDIGYGALKPGSGFTITSHNFVPGRKWILDYKINSAELWSSNPCLPHTILTFPQANINRPHVVQFLMSESKYVIKRMWVVSINMPTGMVESISQYVNGKEGLKGDDADFTRRRSGAPASFIPCEFFRFLRLSQADEAAFDDVHQDKQNNYIQSGGSIVLGGSSDGGAD